jgi:hypothetical protein
MGCEPGFIRGRPCDRARLRREREPYVSLARALLHQDQTKEEQTMRWIGLDCHLEFVEVAILDPAGGLVSAGRTESSEEAIGLFAEGLAADDRVALESSANAAAIAALVRRYVGQVVSPTRAAWPRLRRRGRRPIASTRARWPSSCEQARRRKSGCRTSAPGPGGGSARVAPP